MTSIAPNWVSVVAQVRPRRTSHSLSAVLARIRIPTPTAMPIGSASTPSICGKDHADQRHHHELLEQLAVEQPRRDPLALAGDGRWIHHRLARIGIEGQRTVGRWEAVGEQPAREQRQQSDRDDGHDDDARAVGDRLGPARIGADAEDVLLEEVGHVELRDVDPPLLRQLDDDPDECRRADDQPARHPARIPASADRLVEVEEVLERVRKDQEHGPDLGELEEHDADEPIEVEEAADVERDEVGPVPQRGDVGDRKVVDVERLVVALVVGQIEVGEGREDRLVDAIDDQAGEHRRQRIAEDCQGDKHPGGDDDAEDEAIHARISIGCDVVLPAGYRAATRVILAP